MHVRNPSGLSIVTLAGVVLVIYFMAVGCTPMPVTPNPLIPEVQAVEITNAPSHIANGGKPETGQYKVTLKHPARDGQTMTVKIFEDDEIWDERIFEEHVTLKLGAVEHSGSFHLACNAGGSMIGSTYHDKDGVYEIYASVTDSFGDIIEEFLANRVRCVPDHSMPQDTGSQQES